MEVHLDVDLGVLLGVGLHIYLGVHLSVTFRLSIVGLILDLGLHLCVGLNFVLGLYLGLGVHLDLGLRLRHDPLLSCGLLHNDNLAEGAKLGDKFVNIRQSEATATWCGDPRMPREVIIIAISAEI